MRKMMVMLLLVCAIASYSAYAVGSTVNPSDNISWTISGPAGHPEVGKSDNIFNMVGSKLKPVVIFWGQTS
jgi:hypothetical protein